MNRKCGQNVATDDRTFTDKDKVRCIQTLGSDYKHGGHKTTQNRSGSPFIVISGLPR